MRFTECKHKRLTFGSGAYHVICMDCQTFWNQSTPVVNNSLVYMQDLRVEPEDETIKDREADPELYRRQLTLMAIRHQETAENARAKLETFNSRRRERHKTESPECPHCKSGEHNERTEF